MPTQHIEKNHWQRYFEQASRGLPASNVDIEVSGLDLGHQVEAHHLPLEGLSYDPNDDAFSIVCQGLEHRIAHPRKVAVRQQGRRLEAIEIVDDDDHKHVAKLTGALELPE